MSMNLMRQRMVPTGRAKGALEVQQDEDRTSQQQQIQGDARPTQVKHPGRRDPSLPEGIDEVLAKEEGEPGRKEKGAGERQPPFAQELPRISPGVAQAEQKPDATEMRPCTASTSAAKEPSQPGEGMGGRRSRCRPLPPRLRAYPRQTPSRRGFGPFLVAFQPPKLPRRRRLRKIVGRQNSLSGTGGLNPHFESGKRQDQEQRLRGSILLDPFQNPGRKTGERAGLPWPIKKKLHRHLPVQLH